MFDRYTKLFCIGYLFGIGGAMLLLYFLTMLFKIEPSTNAAFVPLIAGTIFAAQKYATEIGEVPTKGASWGYALRWSFFSIIISAILSAVIFGVFVPETLPIMIAHYLNVVIITLAIVFAISLLLIRFMFPFLVKSQLKAIEKRKARK